MITANAPTVPASPFTPQTIWEMVIGQLRMQMEKDSFNAYIRDCRMVELTGESVTVLATGAYERDWLASRMTSTFARYFAPLVGHEIQIHFVYPGEIGGLQGQASASESHRPAGADTSGAITTRQASMRSGAGVTASVDAGSAPIAKTPESARIAQRQGETGEVARPTARGLIAQSQMVQSPESVGLQARSQMIARNGQQVQPTPATSSVNETLVMDPAPERLSAQVSSVTGLGGPSAEAASTAKAPDEACAWIEMEEVADSIEAALQNRGRFVAFPRYELRHIPLVGPEFFFLRLAFLQTRFLNTQPNARGQSFVTPVEALLQWANVGRATLHRFKKGDPARGVQPAAPWFGIEQLPGAPRSGPTQPPCRYRLQTGIPLTPMDAGRLREQLTAAGVQADPLGALRTLCERPVQEILQFPPPAPGEAHRQQKPAFLSVANVVQSTLGSWKVPAEQRGEYQDLVNRLSDTITMPQQMVFVSWYFLQEWLPILGHDAAALVLYARAQGYYNPQTQELRDVVPVAGGYSELAGVIGLKRERTIGDWLPNIFERQAEPGSRATESEKWKHEQQRQKGVQETVGRFMQVTPGSRKKTASGHYAFHLHVEIKGEPLTPRDQLAGRWVRQVLADCTEAGVLEHFTAWVTSPVIAHNAGSTASGAVSAAERGSVISQNDGVGILPLPASTAPSSQNDGAGTLPLAPSACANPAPQNDGWGILAFREMTARESTALEPDGWGILEEILNDGAGILSADEMTAGELFKVLFRLNTFWKTIPQYHPTPKSAPETGEPEASAGRVVASSVKAVWNWEDLLKHNGGNNPYRQQIAESEKDARVLVSWLCYAHSLKGQGIKDPFGWALARVKDQPGSWAEGVYAELAQIVPAEFARLLERHIEAGMSPADERWEAAFGKVALGRLKELGTVLGLWGV
jgi:hypothetical protein